MKQKTLTNTQAGIVPSPIVWSAYSFRFGLSCMKAWLVADNPSSWRYPGNNYYRRPVREKQQQRLINPKYNVGSALAFIKHQTLAAKKPVYSQITAS